MSGRYNGPGRFSAAGSFYNRSYGTAGPRIYHNTTALRNSAHFANRASFSGDRTTAFNARTASNASIPLANRSRATRTQGFNNQERVIARRSASWQRNWDRSRDHWWHGRRCHFHNNVWVIYEPFFGYPFGYGYYPYGGYYDSGYYDSGYYGDGYYDNGYYADTYASNQYSGPVDESQPQIDTGSRVDDVQRALAHEGYYDGPIDGRLGNATRKALRKYQRDRGLRVTGSIDQPVIESLRLR